MKRTIQFNPLKSPVYVLAKPIGAACNLRCNYCYFLEKEKLRPKSSPPKMSDAVLEAFTEQLINAQPGNEVQFTWHGGEPLLLGVDYFRKALRYQKIYGAGKKIENVLQTNGILLTDEWGQFFRQNNFLIGISIDGPEHCHNKYRNDRDGKGSFEQVVAGIHLLQKHGVEFNILSVINDYNVNYPLEVYQFFKSIGGKYIQFSPIAERINSTGFFSEVESAEGQLTDWSVNPLAYGKFLTAIFDEWVRNDVGEIYVTMFDATLSGMVGSAPCTCIFAETCGHAAALDAQGNLFSCDHFVFPSQNRGNIKQKTITEMMLSPEQIKFGNDKRDKLSPVCRSCKYLKLCWGECPKNRFIRLKDGSDHNYLCEGLKHYFAHVEPHMKYMANELANNRPPSNIMNSIR
ncbi:MAG: anaerobic sulfatase-maturation protein [Bacteroidales bacterium]